MKRNYELIIAIAVITFILIIYKFNYSTDSNLVNEIGIESIDSISSNSHIMNIYSYLI